MFAAMRTLDLIGTPKRAADVVRAEAGALRPVYAAVEGQTGPNSGRRDQEGVRE
jgi:hypothetical protein